MDRTHFYIDGRWQAPVDTAQIEVISPVDGSALAKIPAGTPADVDRAVVAARQAFDGWAATPKLLALTAESPRPTAPALTVPTLDDVRLPVAASGRPVGRAASQARLKERLRVLICMREMRRGTVAELVAACGTRTGRTIRDLKALQRLGHVQTDFVTWEITE